MAVFSTSPPAGVDRRANMNDPVPQPSAGATRGQPISGGFFSPGNLLVYLVAAVPILIKLVCYPAYPGSDDAYIHLTMVRNLTHALGWGNQSA